MDPATIPNGCLWFIPGSHHVTRFEPFPITENMDQVFEKALGQFPGERRAFLSRKLQYVREYSRGIHDTKSSTTRTAESFGVVRLDIASSRIRCYRDGAANLL